MELVRLDLRAGEVLAREALDPGPVGGLQQEHDVPVAGHRVAAAHPVGHEEAREAAREVHAGPPPARRRARSRLAPASPRSSPARGASRRPPGALPLVWGGLARRGAASVGEAARRGALRHPSPQHRACQGRRRAIAARSGAHGGGTASSPQANFTVCNVSFHGPAGPGTRDGTGRPPGPPRTPRSDPSRSVTPGRAPPGPAQRRAFCRTWAGRPAGSTSMPSRFSLARSPTREMPRIRAAAVRLPRVCSTTARMCSASTSASVRCTSRGTRGSCGAVAWRR